MMMKDRPNFEQLTRAEAVAPGKSEVVFQEETVVWSVSGGYIATALIRCAAGELKSRLMPLSVSCDFLYQVKAGVKATITCSVMKESASLALVAAVIEQGGAKCAIAHIWFSDASGASSADMTHRPMPDAPHYDELKDIYENRSERLPPFWDGYELRAINWKNRRSRKNMRPLAMTWFRHSPVATFSCDYTDRCRVVPLLDTYWFASLTGFYALQGITPTLRLHVDFIGDAPMPEWLLCESRTDLLRAKTIYSDAYIWSGEGNPVAYGRVVLAKTSRKGTHVEG